MASESAFGPVLASGMASESASGPVLASGTVLDPELDALPKPRRPWRRFTLATLAATAAFSLWVGHQLKPQVVYALGGLGAAEHPLDLGELARAVREERKTRDGWVENSWVRAAGQLGAMSPSYRRPFDKDEFKVAPLVGVPRVWVELRVPAAYAGSAYVPPTSFVGRFVPIEDSGLGHRALARFVGEQSRANSVAATWLLIDGESRASLRWVLAAVLMLFGFAGFSLWSLLRILRPPAR